MRVATKNALSFALFCVAERALGNFGCQPQPAAVQAVQTSDQPLVLVVQFLQLQKDPLADLAEETVVDDEAVELVSVDGDVALAFVFPDELLVDRDADQVRHDLRESMIVVPFDPHDLNAAFRVRQLADVREELPVALGEAAEVEIAKDVTEKNETTEAQALKKVERFARARHLRSEMQIGEDDRIYSRRGLHASIGNKGALGWGQHPMKSQ